MPGRARRHERLRRTARRRPARTRRRARWCRGSVTSPIAAGARHQAHLHPREAGERQLEEVGVLGRSRMSGRWLVPPKPVMRCCT